MRGPVQINGRQSILHKNSSTNIKNGARHKLALISGTITESIEKFHANLGLNVVKIC